MKCVLYATTTARAFFFFCSYYLHIQVDYVEEVQTETEEYKRQKRKIKKLLKAYQEDNIHMLAETSYLQYSIHTVDQLSKKTKQSESYWKIIHILKNLYEQF